MVTECPQCASLQVRRADRNGTTAYSPYHYRCLACGCVWFLSPATSAGEGPNYIIHRAEDSRGATSP